MTFSVSQFPRGLLSLLNIQSGGRAPNQLAEIINPTIDVSELYLAQGMIQTAQGTPGAPSAGNNPLVTIPPNEIWKVYQFSASLGLGAGGTGVVAPTVVLNSTNSNLLGELVNGIANGTVWSQSWNLPIWFPAGTQFGAFCNGLAVATVASVSLLYTPLRAGG